MARTYVINQQEGSRVPFLRGILTRSLQSAGMEFEEAYELASRVRDELADEHEISSDALRECVLKRLKKQPAEIVEQYGAAMVSPRTVMVKELNGEANAFSRQRHQRNLEAAGLAAKEAEAVTLAVYDEILQAGMDEIAVGELDRRTYETIRDQLGRKPAKRFLTWIEFMMSGRPLLLLIGGTNGCGKSTIATEVAHRLDIVRIQSTDMLREVMRQMLPDHLLPVLHESSFNAWKALPFVHEHPDSERLHEEGFRTQAELLQVPSEAVLNRARQERVSMVLEGIHILPGLGERIQLPVSQDDSIVVSITLAVLRPRELKKRLRGRGTQAPERRAERYLKNFDAIWQLQSLLLSDADQYDAAIIENDKKSRVVQEVMLTINRVLARHFSGTPSEVFGDGAK